ncbi:MAG: cyclic pyranopterin monophosphate synthase MoaC [Candidatus Woesearchaeota archaeon]
MVKMAMTDISQKKPVKRSATAVGSIFLKDTTIDAVRAGKIKKGDPLVAAEIAGINAAKQTSLLIPLCHNIQLDLVSLNFLVRKDRIKAMCEVSADAKTGVEMEALVGVSVALLTIWDMVKYLEKDVTGQYNHAKISDVQVKKKVKWE